MGAKVAGGAAVAGGSALAGGLAVGAGLAGLGALIYALQQQGNVLDENKNKKAKHFYASLFISVFIFYFFSFIILFMANPVPKSA